MFIFWIYSIQIGIDLFTYVFIHVFICLLFIYLPIYLVLFWGVFFSYCKLVKLDGTSTLENGTKCVSHSARKKTKTNAGGIPNSEQRDITLGAILLRKHYYGWRAQSYDGCWGRKSLFSLDFCAKLPRLLDAILDNLHKLSRSMLNLAHGFLPLSFNFQQKKWENISQKKTVLMVDNPTTFKLKLRC